MTHRPDARMQFGQYEDVDSTRRSLTRRNLFRWAACLTGPTIALPKVKTRADEDFNKLYAKDATDDAIDSAIDFLVTKQRDNGAIYDSSHQIAMTSLAIMAMAAVGEQPDRDTRRGIVMSKAINFVLDERHQDKFGYFGRRDGSRMYGHGITTLMLTEMLGMGSDVAQNARIHAALEKALALILKAQLVPKKERLRGGWRYAPDSADSDLSVSVWQLMALRSAKNDGMDVPSEAIDLAVEYLRNSYTAVRLPDGSYRESTAGFSYMPGNRNGTFAMTAAGLLAMQVCGQYNSPLVTGSAKWLLQRPPKPSERFFFYGVYYYAQGMHQVGDVYAETAGELVQELLLKSQRGDGSWRGKSGEERNIGSVYSTALAVLSLSVRYHYLPIYQR